MNSEILEKIGILNSQEIYYNPSYEMLFDHETKNELSGYEKGVLTKLDAVAVDTGKFTGRSPKDKYFVEEPTSKDHLWWANGQNGSDNKKITEEDWKYLKKLALEQLANKNLYIVDCFCGANPDTRISLRLVTEVAWVAHFTKNMFLRPTEQELENFKPDWTLLSACKTSNPEYQKMKMNTEVFVAFHIGERMTLIGGSWYGGEIKKGIFSIMNYFLPLKEIGAFHCSANTSDDHGTALYFGLSGTGKTTLSADPNRALIGDDEHGWDDDGIFNFEGGCYAKCIKLSEEKEPDIYHAIRRNALLENVVVDPEGNVDFSSNAKTENTRVSYPIYHIENIVKPISKGPHPKHIIFLTCDAFGVLPPVSKLEHEQAMYHYLSGYTAKVAGTELGIKEPTATFSACFGQAFLTLHPTKYALVLAKKMKEHGSRAYLVNTGWTGGGYGKGERMDLSQTRAIVNAILDGTLDQCEFENFPVFNLQIPRSLKGVNETILNPKKTWQNEEAYDKARLKLAKMFVENFDKYTDVPEGKKLVSVGPQIK